MDEGVRGFDILFARGEDEVRGGGKNIFKVKLPA